MMASKAKVTVKDTRNSVRSIVLVVVGLVAVTLSLVFSVSYASASATLTESGYELTLVTPEEGSGILSENNYKANFIVNPATSGLSRTEGDYRIGLNVYTSGVGGEYSEEGFKLYLVPEQAFISYSYDITANDPAPPSEGPDCTCGDICVNETGWWRDGGAFYPSNTPVQHAINNATTGEIICVKDGTYTENVKMNGEHLTIKSENGSASTTVEASDTNDHVFNVTANYTNISGFTVTGAGWDKAGIYLCYADYCNISNNNASNSDNGIYLYHSSNTALTGNIVNSNSFRGIYLCSLSHYNTLTNNTASSNSYGIFLYSSSYNKLTNNTANSNDYGIDLHYSSNNNLTNNTAKENNYFDLHFFAGSDLQCNNRIENMTGSGNRPIKYYNSSVNLSDETFSELILCNADNSNINNVTIEGSGEKKNNGLSALWTDNSNLTNINSSNNWYGIRLLRSSNNNLTNNTANSNNEYSIYLRESSNNNTLTNNTANSNNGDGIRLDFSTGNNLTNNNLTNNTEYGVRLVSSSNNTLISNILKNNTWAGINLVSSSNNTLTSNIMEDNDGDGIYLESSSNYNSLTNNNASNNNNYDFHSDENSHNNTVKGLTISSYPTTISFTYDNGIGIKGVATPEPDPSGKMNISKFVDATNVTANSWVFLNVSYRDADVIGVDEASLKMYRHNGTGWELADGSGINGVNTVENYVYANITEFSVFAPLGNEEAPSPCYIATATYGTPLDSNIDVLRDFRYDVLMTNPIGVIFVSTYYKTSPPIADALRANKGLRTATRLALISPLVSLSGLALSGIWVVFIFILGLAAVLLLRRDRKGILKSLLAGIGSIPVFIAAIFSLGFVGYTIPFCAVIGAYLLPFVIPVSAFLAICVFSNKI